MATDKPLSKFHQACELFNQGKHPYDPDVKALKLKGSTRANYYSTWARLNPEAFKKFNPGAPAPTPLEVGDVPAKAKTTATKAKGKAMEYETEVSEGRPLEEKEEGTQTEGTKANGTQTKAEEKGIRMGLDEKPDIPVAEDGGHESKGLPEKVIGNGIEVTVRLSLKTLCFWQIVHTMSPGLSLGDYIDQISDDFWIGRGKDLGILELSVPASSLGGKDGSR